MKLLIAFIAACLMSAVALAQSKVNITVVIGSAASQSNVPVMLKMLDLANEIQDQYHFRPEFKPGAQGVLAVKHMDQEPHTRISSIANSFVENVRAGQLQEDQYVVVNGFGDACWAVITNVGDTRRGIASLQDLRGQEILVGGTGIGNANHIISLILGERYGFRVRYVVYKSNFDALTNMVGDNNSVNFTLERIVNYQQFKDKNPRLQILGLNCPARHPAMPELRTLREQGLGPVPVVWNMFVANRAMDPVRREEISRILDRAQAKLGKDTMMNMADMLAPQFANVSADEYFRSRIDIQRSNLQRFHAQIEASR
jgi:tripartite-type tricarboxylate transporter receptor subunit TctC